MAAVQSVYATAGLQLTTEADAKMRAYVAQNQSSKHAKADYSAEDFGLDLGLLKADFAPYYQRFGLSA